MNQQKDGGPAFPQIDTRTAGENGDYRQETYSYGGMTLRQWYAGQALIGLAASNNGHWFGAQDTPEMARRAFAAADAMLAQVQP